MKLVPAGETCLPQVCAMTANCIAYMRAHGIEQWDEIYPTLKNFQDDVAQQNLFVLKTETNALAGCATLDTKQAPEYATATWLWNEAPIGVVHRVMVAPEHMGKGCAKVIMAGIEAEARRREYRSLRLDAFLQNPSAMKMYESLGYRRAGEIRLRKGQFMCFERKLEA